MFDFDAALAKRYGGFASYPSAANPLHIEYYGESPAAEMDRLLDRYSTPERTVLDIGCGAGFTLCRLASTVKAIWGLDQAADLLQAARLRVEQLGLTNATLVHGSSYDGEVLKSLPHATFDLAFSRRGPDLSVDLLRTLRKDATFVQELVSDQDGYSLLEVFGRRNNPPLYADHQIKLHTYTGFGLLPVSYKEYFYEEFYRDSEHLEALFLQVPPMLSPWWIRQKQNQRPYDPSRDRPALDLYARYNTTPKGIRVLRQRKILVLRRSA
ncbi:MAG TPA: class I SAM-dependent methyltransferase [Ktedonosporobacter sp.]|nr:class I SAM-dependent methyltransferase [Ktedonosporobacter sp.]